MACWQCGWKVMRTRAYFKGTNNCFVLLDFFWQWGGESSWHPRKQEHGLKKIPAADGVSFWFSSVNYDLLGKQRFFTFGFFVNQDTLLYWDKNDSSVWIRNHPPQIYLITSLEIIAMTLDNFMFMTINCEVLYIELCFKNFRSILTEAVT